VRFENATLSSKSTFMRGYSPYGASGLSTQNTPFTLALIAINFVTLVAVTFRLIDPAWLALTVPGALARPWTLLTYPLVSFGIIGLLFYGIWIYFIGSALERAWGTVNYVVFFIAVSVVSGISLELGAMLTHSRLLVDNWLPMAAVTLAFCLLMPYVTILLFIFPVQARILGWIEMAIVFFTYASRSPLLGFFALAGCGVAWLWINRGIAAKSTFGSFHPRPISRRTSRPRERLPLMEKINPLEWWKRYKRRKQFERLMRGE